MKTKTKKGFTLVELVIVIAVIAVLAAVLIPAFSSLIDKANESKDIQLIRNLNTALQSDAKEHKTMTEALEAAENFGYNISKINASATDNEILWDSVNDVFCYLNNDNIEYIPDTALGTKKVADTKYYQICKEVPTNQTYSIYWIGENSKTLDLTVGFDAGYSNDVSINYTGSSKDVVIKTNGGNLTINNDDADVIHYGAAQSVDIEACANSSYHEFGQVYQMKITKGHVVIENGAYVSEITEVETGGDVENNGGYINSIPENSNINQGTSQIIEIGTAAELATFRDSVNMGITYEGLTVKLTADISLSGYENWNPIGNRYTLCNNEIVDWNKDNNNNAIRRIFKGTFDGQGHKISDMNINSLANNYQGLRAAQNDVTNSSYAALFGYISDATLENFTISGNVLGVDVAGVVGITGGTCTIENVISNVGLGVNQGTNEENSIRAKAAGFVCCPKGNVLTIKNCTNNGNVYQLTESSTEPAGGFIGYIGFGDLTLENCTNNGNIETNQGTTSGFIGNIQANKSMNIKINNCINNGTIKGSYSGSIIGRICHIAYSYLPKNTRVKLEISTSSNNGVCKTTATDRNQYDIYVGVLENSDNVIEYSGEPTNNK